MKKLILISIISLLLLSPVFILAQTDLTTAKPGITPDSPFYFLDKWGEKINLFFIFSSETKAEKALQFAEERIAEVKAMAEKNNVGAMQSADNNYQELIALANQKTQEAKDNGKNVEELASLITEKTLNHQEILAQVFEKVPEEAKVAIEQAIKTSRNGSEEAVKAVSGDKKDELLQKMEEVKFKINEKFAALEEKIIVLEQKIEEKNTNNEIKNKGTTNKNQPQLSQQNQQEQNTANQSPQNTLNQIQQNTQQVIQNTTPPTCSPDWECDSWSACANSQRTRICSDLNNCGVTAGKPSGVQSCVAICTPNWQCGSWNSCTDSQQSRVCTDSNSCGVSSGKPTENQSCVNPVSPSLSKVRLILMDDDANKIKITDEKNTKINIRVYVYDEKGLNSTASNIKVEAPDISQNLTISADDHLFTNSTQCDGQGGCIPDHYYYLFTYLPKKIGQQSIKFTSSKFNSSAEMKFTVSSDVCSGGTAKDVNKYIENNQIDKIKSVIDMCNGQNSALAYMLPTATYYNNIEIVKYLLDSNFNVNYQTDFTALMHASSKANLDMVNLLIDRGADVNLHGGSGGITALMYSFVEGKNLDVPKLLLQKGANPNSTQTDGKTALLGAPLHGADAVKLLLDYGANPNLKYSNGTTALINASWVGDIESTKLLVAAGADVNVKNDSGSTALSTAIERGYTEIADYLKQHGAVN